MTAATAFDLLIDSEDTPADRVSATSVTVTFNSVDTIKVALESLLGQVAEVIVVDNASTDGTQDVVRTMPGVRLIELKRNVGFAAGTNVGLHERSHADVVLVNPDVTCAEFSVASLARVCRSHGSKHIVVPALIYPDGTAQSSARTFPSFGALLARRTILARTRLGQQLAAAHLMSAGIPDESMVDWAIGAAMFVPGNLLSALGDMDEQFFLYCEDVDWCLRAWRLGGGVMYTRQATFTHNYARSSRHTLNIMNRTTRLHWASMVRLMVKYPSLMLNRSPRQWQSS